MQAVPHRPMMDVEGYLQLDRNSIEARYEYIDGRVTMLAGGTLDHATIAANVISILRGLLRGSSCRVFTSDARVRLTETRYVYPDVSVSCDERDRGLVDTVQSPRVVVEVLSPSTEAYDRGRKLAYYRQCPAVQEYVLIDSQHQAVEIYRRERNTLWTYQALGLGEEVALASLGIRFAVAAVYEDVVLPPEDDLPA
jgi:Uma2 family endonuclease